MLRLPKLCSPGVSAPCRCGTRWTRARGLQPREVPGRIRGLGFRVSPFSTKAESIGWRDLILLGFRVSFQSLSFTAGARFVWLYRCSQCTGQSLSLKPRCSCCRASYRTTRASRQLHTLSASLVHHLTSSFVLGTPTASAPYCSHLARSYRELVDAPFGALRTKTDLFRNLK